LLDTTALDSVYIPIEAFTQFSVLNEDLVATMAPKIAQKLMKLFKTCGNEGQIG
jgi:hypothetical protein